MQAGGRQAGCGAELSGHKGRGKSGGNLRVLFRRHTRTQDVDILPQISGRIIRLKVKEGERVKTGQVLAVIDQVPYRAALRTAQANVSAAQAKVETARKWENCS